MGKEFSVVLSSNLARISKMTITLSKCVFMATVNKINPKHGKFFLIVLDWFQNLELYFQYFVDGLGYKSIIISNYYLPTFRN